MDKANSEKQPSNTRMMNTRFASEALLQQAIAGLLTRMPDTSGVQILQGALELGKDIIFYTHGGFEDLLLCACVVKNSRITGDAGKSEGARTVFLQAQQAFDSPHTDGHGNDIYVERVYVLTPFDLPPATIRSISGQLKERSGQVVFIGGPKLFDLFKKYWPDFVADEANAIEYHLGQTKRNIDDYDPLSGIAVQHNLGTVDANARKVYVPQLFHRDLHTCRTGPVLVSAIPDTSKLSREWTNIELRAVLGDLKKFEQALGFLQEWGYYSNDNNSDRDQNIRSLLPHFSFALEQAWKESVRKKFGSNTLRTPRIASDVRVSLHDPATLLTPLKRLHQLRTVALSPLEVALQILSNVVSSPPTRGARLLSNPSFLKACKLDNCIQTASEGLFEETDKLRVKFSKNLLDAREGHLMIVGAPGYGKTSFCRWYALQDAEKFTSGKSKTIPVYVPLHRLATRKIGTFEETFLESLGKSALIARAGEEVSSKTYEGVRLYLDGLDEIASPTRRREIAELARNGPENDRDYQVILTARDNIHGSWLDWLPRVSLSGFGDAEIVELVSKWLGKNTQDARKFREDLRGTPTLANLMRTPLLATLIILVFRQTGRLPESKTRLYEMFIDLLSGGWDMAKRILRQSKYGQRIKVMVLKTLAGALHEAGKREFGDSEIKLAIKATLSSPILDDWESLRDEFVQDGLVTKSGTVLQFSHLSFQEFLTAKDFLGDPRHKRVRQALAALLFGNDWWKEVIKFYIGLLGRPKEITLWLLSEIDRIAHTEGRLERHRMDEIFDGVTEAFPEFAIEELLPSRTKKGRI